MDKIRIGFLGTALAFAVLLIGLSIPAHAQLVNIHKDYRVVRLELDHNRIVVESMNGETNPQYFVEVDGNTRVYRHGHTINWKTIQPGDAINVDGGLRVDGRIAGKTIHLLERAGE